MLSKIINIFLWNTVFQSCAFDKDLIFYEIKLRFRSNNIW